MALQPTSCGASDGLRKQMDRKMRMDGKLFRRDIFEGLSGVCLLGWMLLAAALPARAEVPDYAAVLAGMQEQLERTVDYHCRFETWSAEGQRTRAVVLAYTYRQPASVRMEVLEGPYAGSLLLYNRETDPRRVRVMAGNPLLAVLQRMLYGEFFAVDHEWMVDLRGNGIHESHWPHLLAVHRKVLQEGTSRFLGEEQLDGRRTLRYRLVSHLADAPRAISAEEVWVDADSYFPVRFLQYDASGRLVREAKATGLKFNTGIDEEWFKEFQPETR